MNVSIVTKPVPLHLDAAGVLRVGNTLVSLDSVLAAFHDGATPEETVQQYDTISLADVYAVISYYLEHQQDIDTYLAARRTQREQLRRTSKPGTLRTASGKASSPGPNQPDQNRDRTRP